MKKNLNLVTVIAIIGLAAFSGCFKSSTFNLNPTPNKIVEPGFMKASVNGAPFADTSSLVFSISGTQMGITGAESVVLGADSTNVYIQITLGINSYKGAGTYIIPGTGISDNFFSIDSTEPPIYAAYGTVTAVYGAVIITATTPNIVGTFSFTCADSTKITNGSFSAQTP